MLCDKCNKNEASIYITELTNQGQVKHHLCESCALKLGLLTEKNNIFSINDFLSGIFNHETVGGNEVKPVKLKPELTCPNCQMTYNDFKRTGKIGCSVCYKTFAVRLEPFLRRIHGYSSHIGKIPRRAGGDLGLKQEIAALRQKIKEFINDEEYEQAAVLRDRIKLLENQLNTNLHKEQAGDIND